MRPIARPRLSFPELNAATDTLTNGYRAGKPYNPSFDKKKWRPPRVLGALHAMHGQACAYCQGQLTPSDRGDVEHFRPKSAYWWLAYVFDNYLWSCMRCNRIRKGKKFPLEPGEGGLRYGDGRSVGDERQLLLDPSRDPVDGIAMKLVRSTWMLEPKKRHGVPDPKADETIRFFELNLGGIPGARLEVITKASEEAKKIRDGSGDRAELHRLTSRFRPYGADARRVLERAYADLLPQPRDEAMMLIAELRTQLESNDASLQMSPGHGDTTALRETALWALAVLWHSPPKGVKMREVSKWMGDGYRPEVQTLRKLLRADLAKAAGRA